MAIARGTNIVTDGLVYGYDSGYGVADKHTSTRFYQGEPTTNLKSNAQTSGMLSGMQGITITHVGEEDGYQKYSMNGTFNGNTYPYIMNLGSGVSFTGGVKYSTQAKIKTNVASKFNYFGTTGVNYVNQAMDHGGSKSSTFIAAEGCYLVKNEGFAYTANQTQTGYLFTNPINGTTFNSSTDFVYIKDFQIEQQDHCTPHTATSRSNTGSLIDLKRNVNVDVSNANFDSTGQPDFDGTDDRIVSSTSIDLSSYTSLTYEGVVKAVGLASHDRWLSATNSGDTGFHNPDLAIGTDGQLRYYFQNLGVSWIAPSGLTIDTTKFNHLVYTFTNSGVVKIYINGTQQHTATYSGSHTFPSNSKFMTGMRFDNNGEGVDGSIPIVKVYSKALTADEVTQNYKAYKNRFNL